MFSNMSNIPVIVSMTSFPGRIYLVPKAYSHFIQHQTRKADRYVLWLSKAEFGGEKTASELGLEDIVSLGVEVHWCEEDSKIHIRHNSCREWPEAYNIMIDEDIFYPSTYIEELMAGAEKHPGCVISYFSCFEIFTGYKKYELPRFPWPSTRNKFNGGLVCFPPNTYPSVCFKYAEVRDKICPFHDETWVNLFLKFCGTKVYGLHSIDWTVFKELDANTINLHDAHKKVEAKYSLDVIQFNRVLCVFPQLMNVYRKNVFGLYWFRDKGELNSYSKYGRCNDIR